MHNELEKDLNRFSDSFKDYINNQLDLEKLALLKKLSQLGSYLFKIFVIMYFSIIIVGFLLGALAVWSGSRVGSYFLGVLIAGAALVVVAVLLILVRKKIAVRSVVKNLSKILLNDD